MTTEYLRGPSSTYGSYFGTLVHRTPVLYMPETGIDVNASRLPPTESLRGMQIAFRQGGLDEVGLSCRGTRYLLVALIGSLLAALVAVFVAAFVPIKAGLTVAAGIGFLLVLLTIPITGIGNLQRLFVFLKPSLLLLLLKVAGLLFQYRVWATGLLAIITLVIFLKEARNPFSFYRDWLYAHPRLRPETRRHPEAIRLDPNFGVLIGIMGIVTFAPILSPSLAILGVLVLCAVVLRKDVVPTRLFQRAAMVFARYLSYGIPGIPAPGLWMPRVDFDTRFRRLTLTVAPLFLTLVVGLHMFCPVDLLVDNMNLDHVQKKDFVSTPYSWIDIAAEEAAFLPFPFAIVLAVLVPFYSIAAIYNRPTKEAESLRLRIEGGGEGAPDDDGRCEWQWYVDRLRDSRHEARNPLAETVREAEHLFLGVGPAAMFPVLFDKRLLEEHCYIVGETGSGKTSRGIMPLLLQLIRGHSSKMADETIGVSEQPPIVVLDLKGDNALFQLVKRESEERRRQAGIEDPADPRYAFRFFTPEKGMPSHYFNPFDSLQTEARTEIQLCHLFLDALNLNHGEGYGRSYYSRRNRMLLFDALAKEPKSLKELYGYLKAMTRDRKDPLRLRGSNESYPDTFELVSTIHALTQYEMLATSANVEHPEQSIHMPSVIENRQVAYFWLPAALESISVREIGKLALFSLLTAAIDRQRGLAPLHQTYLVIDEFQRIAGENFKIVLEQARSFGISAILANQTQSDLRTHDIDLRPTIRTNTRTKMYFSVTDPEEVKSLSEASGEEIAFVESTSESSNRRHTAHGWTQTLKPRLTRNDILSASDHPLEFIFHVSRGSGYTQFGGMPLVVRTTYCLDHDTYKELAGAPWPATSARKTREEVEETAARDRPAEGGRMQVREEPTEDVVDHADLEPEGTMSASPIDDGTATTGGDSSAQQLEHATEAVTVVSSKSPLDRDLEARRIAHEELEALFAELEE